MNESTWNPLESLTLKGEEETIKTADAIELAYAFAAYKSMRVIDLDTEMDCKLAEGATRRLRRCQDAVGVHLVDTDKLLATEKRMSRYARVIASQV